MADNKRQCVACGRTLHVNWYPGPIPMGHPQLTDHGYIKCGACLKKPCEHCLAASKHPVVKYQPEIETDENGVKIRFLVPLSDVA